MVSSLPMICLLASAAHIDLAGVWLNSEGTVKMTIEDCGDGTPCGVISWLSPTLVDEKRVDRNNSDASKRRRSLLGVRLAWGFARDGDRWTDGSLYNPKDGDTYRAELSLTADGRLEMKGCWGPFCKTKTWTRVPPISGRNE